MKNLDKAKQFIAEAKNISILCSLDFQQDSFPACLALFYTLKDLGKNVNLIAENPPKRFDFLADKAELNPANRADFVITVKGAGSKLSQFFYEKTSQGDLDLFLKTKKGNLDKNDIIFQPLTKPGPKQNFEEELLIAVGVKQLEQAASFLQEPSSAIINLDNNPLNKEYGEVNLVDQESASLSEIAFDLLCELINQDSFNAQTADCLASGIIHATKNLQAEKTNSATLHKLSCLIDQGVSLKAVKQALYGQVSQGSLVIFSKILNKLRINPKKNLALALLKEEDFNQGKTSPADLKFALRKLTSGLFPFNNLLVLWQQKASPLQTKGVFYSGNQRWLSKVMENFEGRQKGEAIIFKASENNLAELEKQILELLE